MKFIFSLCLIISLAAVVLTSSASWGRRTTNDYVVYREKVYRNAIRGYSQSVDVVFPKHGSGFNGNITLINIIDRFTNSSGATGTLRRGGPRFNFTMLNLRSKVSYGINSDIEIYGRYR